MDATLVPVAATQSLGAASLLAGEEASPAAPEAHPRYCPTGLLATFALLMAGHGRCVHTAMMLGDREYAQWQLDCAAGFADGELAAVTARLRGYFQGA